MADPWTIAAALGEVISSVGAVSAVLIAVITQRRQEEFQRRAQASQVTLDLRRLFKSVDYEGIPSWVPRVHRAGRIGESVVLLTATNHSDLPIYKMKMYTPFDAVKSEDESLLDPDSIKLFGRGTEKLDPGLHFAAFYWAGLFEDLAGTILWFTDASGKHWERRIDGALISHTVRKDQEPRRTQRKRIATTPG